MISNPFATRPLAPTHGKQPNPTAVRRTKWLVTVGLIVAITLGLLNFYLQIRRDELPEEIEGVTTFEALPSEVVEGPIVYDQRPPAGGPHAELPQLCGYYRVPVQDEHAVASLATGAVWITYRPDIPAADQEDLRELAEGELEVILAPYEGQEAPILLTAWERQLAVDDPNDERAEMFIYVYRDSERAPDRDETCAAGIGLPVE